MLNDTSITSYSHFPQPFGKADQFHKASQAFDALFLYFYL